MESSWADQLWFVDSFPGNFWSALLDVDTSNHFNYNHLYSKNGCKVHGECLLHYLTWSVLNWAPCWGDGDGDMDASPDETGGGRVWLCNKVTGCWNMMQTDGLRCDHGCSQQCGAHVADRNSVRPTRLKDGNVDRFCIVGVTICFSARMQQKQNEKLMAVEDESSDEEQLAIGGFGVIWSSSGCVLFSVVFHIAIKSCFIVSYPWPLDLLDWILMKAFDIWTLNIS